MRRTGRAIRPPQLDTEMGNVGYGDSLLGERQYSFAKQTHHPTAPLLTETKSKTLQKITKAHPALLPYICVLVGKNASASTEDLWNKC